MARNNQQLTPAVGCRTIKGFTLIEIMVTVSIIAILTAVAIPQYQRHVVRSQRTAASACLMQVSQYMERFYASSISYAENAGGDAPDISSEPCTTSQNGVYAFELTASDADTFLLTATPEGAQSENDVCGAITIDNIGATGQEDGNSTECWRR